MRDAWVLRLKDGAKGKGARDEYYFKDNSPQTDGLTQDINQATIIEDKAAEIDWMKRHEKGMHEVYGPDAVCNYGYTNMMKNFEFVEVEVEELEN